MGTQVSTCRIHQFCISGSAATRREFFLFSPRGTIFVSGRMGPNSTSSQEETFMLFSPPRKTSTRKGRIQLIVFQTLRLLGSSTTGTPGPGLSHSAEGTREALRVREGVSWRGCKTPTRRSPEDVSKRRLRSFMADHPPPALLACRGYVRDTPGRLVVQGCTTCLTVTGASSYSFDLASSATRNPGSSEATKGTPTRLEVSSIW